MIKIGLIALARQINGGTLQYTLSMIDAIERLPSSDYFSTIVTQSDNTEYEKYQLPKEKIESFIKLLIARLFFFKTSFDNFDLIIAPVYTVKLLLINKPFVFTLHDLQERHLPENFSLSTRVWRKMINYFLSVKAVAIICESKFVKNDIIKLIGVNPEKVFVLPAPPQASIFSAQNDAKNILKVPKHYIFYPAQFWPHKNHLRLIDAFKLVHEKFPQYHLVLTGKEAFEFPKVQNKIQNLNLNCFVHHVGYVHQASMSYLFKKATILVMPTLFESISIPVFEAFALGVPVCVSRILALPEQIQDAGLLFDPLDVNDIAEKLMEMLASAELRNECVQKGFQILKYRTTDTYAVQFRELIDSSLSVKKQLSPV